MRARRRPIAWGAGVGLLVAALLLAALRVDTIRLRYRLAASLHEEQRWSERVRELTVAVRRLRDPRRLARLGRELGLEPPRRVIDLERPAPGSAGQGAVP